MNKFNIGDIVYAAVQKRGDRSLSHCSIGKKMKIIAVAKVGNIYYYRTGVGYGDDEYVFKQWEIVSPQEYAEGILNDEM